MAPRKQPPSRDGGRVKGLAPSSNRVIKNTAAAPVRRSARVANQPPKDGLLDLRQIPEHLVAVAKRNAAESPLLRLPPELRNKIWEFALGGEYIKVPVPRGSLSQALFRYYNASLNDKVAEKLLVFRIPSVSRQVYAETATLPYSTNVFIVGRNFQHTHSSWSKALTTAYRNAITTVVVPDLSRATLGVYKNYRYKGKLLPTHFPNLETIEVTATQVDYTTFALVSERYGRDRMTRAEQDEWVTTKLKKKHGEHLNVRVLARGETKQLEEVH